MQRPFPARAVALLSLFVVLLFLGTWSSRSASADADIVLRDVRFNPAEVTVAVGETVTWRHDDGTTPHTVTSDASSGEPEFFDSHAACNPLVGATCMAQGATFTHTYTQAGAFPYHCKVHPSMRGTVVVQSRATTTSPPPASSTSSTGARTATTTSSTRTGASTTTSTTVRSGSSTSATLAPGEAPEVKGDRAEEGKKDDGGDGGGGNGEIALLVLLLLAVAGGGGYLLWRLRPRT